MNAPPQEVSEKLQQQVYKAAADAFAPYMNMNDPDLQRVATRSVHYAEINGSAKIKLDGSMLFLAALEAKMRLAPATYLLKAMSTAGLRERPLFKEIQLEIAENWAHGCEFEIDPLTINSIFPAAKTIASLTSKASKFQLVHLIMAVLHEPPAVHQRIFIDPESDQIARLRGAFVKELISHEDKIGDVSVWRQLVTIPPWELANREGEQAPESVPQQQERQVRQSVKSGTLAAKAVPTKAAKSRGIIKADKASQTSGPPPPTTPPTTQSETLPVHADDPALVDQLGREAFAKVLSTRIVEARGREQDRPDDPNEDENRAFVIHLHGQWGAGKSSVLNFIKADLEKPDEAWLVVKFDAWRSQRVKPAWWSLMLTVHRSAAKAERNIFKRALLSLRWYAMRAKADLLPAIIGLALGALGIWLLGDTLIGTVEAPLKGLIALISALGGVYAFGRSLLFGSSNAAQAFAELRSDPYGPMMDLFCKLVDAIGKPIIVFVDDLDRCERDYVCDLLENIQTMLRGASITYLIAADRRWICTSFEHRYAEFAEPGRNPGRPLGYQFLDKLFQISVNLPQMPVSKRDQFWDGLLKNPKADGKAAEEARSTQIEAQQIAANMTSQAEFRSAMTDLEQRPQLQQAIAAEFVGNISTSEAIAETEHRLKPLAHLVEPNPRSMKRLANSVAMNQARLALEIRYDLEPEEIARWTIIELRWPLLAAWLAEDVTRLVAKTAVKEGDVAMHGLLKDAAVKAVIGGARDKGNLTPGSLSKLLA